ncbi:hypothetical protein HYFRA_00005715 [Hymenoscyphus fraxineus]|uniref:Uncharacterized protein n=1 Tax=Hymenoscyphus fraxineus TaxID=746836 RepID=A0A9N9KR39_9HELO|nr:hypothetical protein HYFRA_00005715 [Hymenoscyphus fraxineus]
METILLGQNSPSISNPLATTTAVKWYMETDDSQICLAAKKTCLEARKDLLELVGDDFDSRDALECTTSAKELIGFVKFYQERVELENSDPGFRRQLLNRVKTFCEFADKITQIVAVMVPQDPKFTIPYGCLALLFKAVTWSKERKDRLDAFLVEIVEVLPIAEAYAELYNTRQIKEEVISMYVTVLKFLAKATMHCRRNNLKKAVDGLFKPTSNPLKTYMTRIKQCSARIHHFQALASAAQQDETLKSVKGISGTLAIVRQEVELMSQEMFAKIDQVEKLWINYQEQAKRDRMLTAYRELSTLSTLLLPSSKPWVSELQAARTQNPEISQRSKWQMLSVIDDLSLWSRTVDDKPLLWLSVIAGNQGTWVTQMITEYQASFRKGDVPLICVFAGVYKSEQLNARSLVCLLIIRIMESFPKVVFEIPDLLNTRVLAQAADPELWEILEVMIRGYRPVLMIIDRIDLCGFLREEGQWSQFLGNMERMVLNLEGDLRVLFTSAEEPSDLVQQAEMFETITSSARIKPSRRDAR